MKQTIEIQNLKCGGCARTVTDGLAEVNGIVVVNKVNPDTGEVEFESNDDLNWEELKQKLHKMGYPLSDEENTLGMKVKSFASCAVGKLKS